MLDFECVLNTGMNPKDLLITLMIDTCCRRPSLYCEVFQEPDGSGKLYWVYSLQYNNRIIQFLQDFCVTCSITKDTGIEEIFANPRFIKEYQKFNSTQWVAVPAEKMVIVRKIMTEGLPKDVHYPSGCDGHEYYLKTYGKNKQEYQSWIEIPKEWGTFAELISVLVEAAGWKQNYKCYFGSNVKEYNNDEATAEIPPWMTR